MALTVKHKAVKKMYKVSKMKPKQQLNLKGKGPKFIKAKKPLLTQNRSHLSKSQIIFLNEVESSQQPQPENTLLTPGLHFLGCGYNIFGSYADESAITERLIDPNKINEWSTTPQGGDKYAHWPFVDFMKLTKALSKTFYGKTLNSMCEAITVKAGLSGSYCGFQGSVNSEIYSSISKSYYHEWFRKLSIISQWKLTLDDPRRIRQYLYQDVAKAINEWPPNKLFKKYGLYFTDGVILGGRFTYTSAVDTYEWNSTNEIKLAVKASYLSFVESSASYASTDTKNKYESSSEIEIETVGGDNVIGGDGISNSQSYLNWRKSVEGEKITLVDFPSNCGLTGIWELASTRKRRRYLQEEAKAYAERVADGKSFSPLGGRRPVNYVIRTKTGNAKYAGTDEKVVARLWGKDKVGGKHNSLWEDLDSPKDDRERGQIDEHRIDRQMDLGEITHIELCHTTKKDGWTCEWVEVENTTNGKKYAARVNRWLKNNRIKISLAKE